MLFFSSALSNYATISQIYFVLQFECLLDPIPLTAPLSYLGGICEKGKW